MKNAGKACNNRLYRHIRTFEKIIKNYFVIYIKNIDKSELVCLIRTNLCKIKVSDSTNLDN